MAVTPSIVVVIVVTRREVLYVLWDLGQGLLFFKVHMSLCTVLNDQVLAYLCRDLQVHTTRLSSSCSKRHSNWQLTLLSVVRRIIIRTCLLHQLKEWKATDSFYTVFVFITKILGCKSIHEYLDRDLIWWDIRRRWWWWKWQTSRSTRS